MTKELPSDERLSFILCELTRREGGNKLSVLGYYPGDEILIDPQRVRKNKEGQVILEDVTVVLTFKDGHGRFHSTVRIEDPQEKVIVEKDMGEVEIRSGRSMTMASQISPFVVRSYGIHKVVVTLDAQKYQRTFSVKEREKEPVKARE